jgi:hypothetical protein
MTQFAVYRYLWWAVMMGAFWRVASDDKPSMIWAGFIALVALGHTISAGIAPNRPVEPTRWLRLCLLVSATFAWALDLLMFAFGPPNWQPLVYAHASDTMILAAEYAATIRTIPPLPAKQKRRARALA